MDNQGDGNLTSFSFPALKSDMPGSDFLAWVLVSKLRNEPQKAAGSWAPSGVGPNAAAVVSVWPGWVHSHQHPVQDW